jgi:hypothetical protein
MHERTEEAISSLVQSRFEKLALMPAMAPLFVFTFLGYKG